LLLILAIYLAQSLESVRQYTPIANAEELQMESVNAIPALLDAMDAERHAWQKTGDGVAQAAYTRTRQAVEAGLLSLNTPVLLASPDETQRRALVRQWIATIGNVAIESPGGQAANVEDFDARSKILLDQLAALTKSVRTEVQATLKQLQEQESMETIGRVSRMWWVVGFVILSTLLINAALANSIIGPLQILADAVRRLQGGDYTVRTQLRSGDEIQSLGETFNAMAENILRTQQELEEKNVRLSSQQKALRNVNVGLEERVAEKTEEIQHALVQAESERAKLQTLIERMPDGLLLLDDAGKIMLSNHAALGILGHPDAASLQLWIKDLPGAFSFRLLNQQALDDADIPYRRVLRGETFSNVSLYLRGHDNQTRIVSFSGAPVLTPLQGQVELSLLLFRDVTQELALRQELEDKNQKLNEAARLKDEFLATLSHELRTPLTPIISCAHLLGTDTRLMPDHIKSVQVIERNARGLSRMIDELLDLSAVMNRKLRLTRERIEMNEWTRATLETMRPAAEKKELKMTFIPAPEPVELEIDATRLAQVLTNLINNAIKFTHPRGKITVRLTAAEKDVRVAVTDNGPGLKQHEIGKIFEMFHQSRTRQTQSVGGLGVGLTVARSLAELHGGGLLAESPGPGQGATFTLWLPRAHDSQAVDFSSPSLAAPPLTVDRTLLRGRRVLLVEDSTDTREALERIFQRRECRVVTADTGEKGLELALREPPDIIISDIGLPGMSGLEFMASLRTHSHLRDVIAIALSGLGREQDVKAALDAGFEAHLLKPVDIAVLDQTLVEALEKRPPS
jgi:signal transduction histidine kinase/ActR/RegA family two-component response regulator/HAMP domain-containing protein